MSIPGYIKEQSMNSTITKRYRVVATTTTGFIDPKVDTTVKWKGTDTDELSRAYPPSDIMFADPFDQKEIEGGLIITRFTFEQQLADGPWEEINDPRRRLTPITDYERAIDEQNRHMYPGDYITSDCDRCGDHGCDECQNPYQVDCTSCDDYGCAKCDPNWCTACDNNGCATCDPASVCQSCQVYRDPQYESLGKDSGLCQSCEYYAKLCVQCSYDDHNGEDHLCGNCRSDNEYEAAPKCSECYDAAVTNEGDNCQSCQVYLDARCVSCERDVADGDDKLCGDCREYYSDLEKCYVWWRRALRACKFWC